MQLHEETIFNEALDIADPEAREKFIEKACAGNHELHRQIEWLLKAYPEGDALEPTCNENRFSTSDESSVREKVGDTIGHYKLLEQLGEGGMGIVYMAEQIKPVRRKVALKIIKVGMDTGQVVARFESERQALALMNHSNIAKVLDAGETETGRPYFVMELVRGIPITEFCDQQKLSNQQRLELFIDVCEAVQHAHQKGIIHRDIKPSNVLVELHDVKAVPKIIDFGIAKATNQQLTERTLFTQFSQMIGTPMYMSPEQAQLSGLDIDTRSDIYSLGVLLYELLTGSPPFDRETFNAATFDEMRRIIREDQPPLPSHRVSTLRAEQNSTIAENQDAKPKLLRSNVERELDWIVMKALEKDRTRRYESANAFGRDVQRHLDGDLVQACPPSMVYRFKKFVKRRRGIVATAALFGVATLVAIALLWNERNQTFAALTEATTERQHAQQQKQNAELQERQAKWNAAEATRQRDSALWNQYCAEVVSGQIDVNQGNVMRLEQKLLRHLPILDQEDRRGWEWYYLFSACHPETRTLVSNVSLLGKNATWSPDGTYIARAGVIFSAETGESVRRFWPSLIRPKEGAWSPDGQMYAWGTAEDDSCIYIWNRSSDELTELRGHKSSVWCVDWGPDGKLLASGGLDMEVWVWDVAARAPIQKLKAKNYVTDVAWSPDGEVLAAGVKLGDLMVWNARSGEQLAHLEDLSDPGAGGYSVRLSWHPDGEQLAVSTPESWFLIRRSDWSVMQQEKRARARGSARGYAIAWRPDGEKIAVLNGEYVSVLDPTDDEVVPALYGPIRFSSTVEWNANSQQFVTSDSRGDVKIWDVSSSMQPPVIRTGIAVQSLSWLSDSETIVAVDAVQHSTSYWCATDGSRIKVEAALADGQIHWGPDRRLAAVLSDAEPERIRILDGTSGSVHSIWEPDSADQVRGVSWSKDGTKLAIRKNRGASTSVELWDADDEKSISIWTLNGVGSRADILFEMAWSPDGTRIAVTAKGEADDNGSVQHQGHVYVVDVSRGVTLLKHNLAGWNDKLIVTSLAWSPDNRTFVAGNYGGLVEAVDVESGQTHFSTRISSAPVRALAWSPDGRRIVSAAEDGAVKVCAAGDGVDLLQFQLDNGARNVSWSPDGERLAAATENGEIHVWDATKGYGYSENGSKRGELAWTYYRSPHRTNAAEEEARLRQVLKLAPDTLGFWELRGHASAKLSDFDRASREFAKAIEPGLRRSLVAAEYYGYALLGAGQREAYRRHCLSLLKAFANTEVPSTGGRVAWLCSLTEHEQSDAEVVLRLARTNSKMYGGDVNPRERSILGAVLYRNQHFKTAADMLGDVADQFVNSSDPKQQANLAASLYFLAMARQQMGHSYQAQRTLADANEKAQDLPATSSWTDRVQLKVLDQEARALIER